MTHIPRRSRFLVALGLVAVSFAPIAAQEKSPLRIDGLSPGGLRVSVTERWGEISFSVANFSDTAREARVVAFYDNEEYTQYARDLHVPARVSVTVWMSLGPVPKLKPGDKAFASNGRTLHFILYDRTGGGMTVVKPNDENRLRDRAVLYRPKSEFTTSLFTDEPVDPDLTSFRHPTADVEAMHLIRCMRHLRGLTEYLSVVRDPNLPATAEAYGGIDQIVLACNRLKTDPHSRAALRQWVERGGQLWVMLDQVDVDLLGSLLGEECAPQIVDRTSLTNLKFQRTSSSDRTQAIGAQFGARDLERPATFVRVALTGREVVHHYIDAWPASFSIRVGRGRILVTTLGPHAWYRPRVLTGPAPNVAPGRIAPPQADPPSPYALDPELPIPTDAFVELTTDLKPVDHPFTVEDLRPILSDQIGYTVPGRGAVAAILAAFVAVLVGIGVLLRRSRKTEILGWLVPGAAIATAVLFPVLGGSTRHSIPPTAAVAEMAEVIPGSGEIARSGLFATYQPDPGSLGLAAPAGGVVDLDFEGLDTSTRIRVQTDRDSWHYEKLSVPGGVRMGPYHTTITGAASALATFGPDGVSGKLVADGFRDPADAIVVARNRNTSGVRIAADGSFAIGAAESRDPGQYFPDTLLTDRQQRRQAIYQKLVGTKLPDHFDNRDFLLAWTTPTDLPFRVNDGARLLGSTLLIVPVEYARPAPGTTVTVPKAYLPYRRILEGYPRDPTLESTRPIEMKLRFQVPMSVVPMTVEKAIFHAKVRAPQRRVIVGGFDGDVATKLTEVPAPSEPIRVEIADPKLLKLDRYGGLHVGLSIQGEAGQAGNLDAFWTIESIHLELTGKTADKP